MVERSPTPLPVAFREHRANFRRDGFTPPPASLYKCYLTISGPAGVGRGGSGRSETREWPLGAWSW